jgi:hypothetical protein
MDINPTFADFVVLWWSLSAIVFISVLATIAEDISTRSKRRKK